MRLGSRRSCSSLAAVAGWLAAAALAGCASSGSGGGTSTGGSTGGNGTGGVTSSGGVTGTGGVTSTGGLTGSGGISNTGGTTNTGGTVGAGGTPSTGGTSGTGGSAGAGGGHGGTGGATGTGGTSSTGGVTGTGGAAGGHAGTGGSAGAGGASGGAGGTANPCPIVTPLSGGQQHCGTSSGSAGGSYTYDLWSDGQGSGCMTVYGVGAAFKANWTNVGDWIARVGLAFDKTKTYSQIGTFSSDFAYTTTGITTGGFGNIGIYGWSVNPLHEYYIAENWLGKKPNFTKVGTFTIDGEGTYDVMTNTQTNQPNITGTNATFVQYWSVNQTPRTCGHISISKHFAEWASLGLQLGTLEETRFLVEGQNNSGTIDFTTLTVVAK
jgi:endo-1,4-beta-xylanase